MFAGAINVTYVCDMPQFGQFGRLRAFCRHLQRRCARAKQSNVQLNATTESIHDCDARRIPEGQGDHVGRREDG